MSFRFTRFAPLLFLALLPLSLAADGGKLENPSPPEPTRRAFLWHLKKDGKESFLFGTYHVGMPLDEVPPNVWQYWQQAKIFVPEISVPAEGFGKSIANWYENGTLHRDESPTAPPNLYRPPRDSEYYYSSPPYLKDRMSATAYARMEKEVVPLIQKQGFFGQLSDGWARGLLQYMRPYYVHTLLMQSRLDPSSDRMDMHLLIAATNQGKTIQALETVDEQKKLLGGYFSLDRLEKMFGSPRDSKRLAGLNAAQLSVENAYRRGDEVAYNQGYLDLLAASGEDLRVFNELSIARNRRWAPKIRELHDRNGGNLFIGVGLTHTFGPENLLEQLAAQGFTVEREEMTTPLQIIDPDAKKISAIFPRYAEIEKQPFYIHIEYFPKYRGYRYHACVMTSDLKDALRTYEELVDMAAHETYPLVNEAAIKGIQKVREYIQYSIGTRDLSKACTLLGDNAEDIVSNGKRLYSNTDMITMTDMFAVFRSMMNGDGVPMPIAQADIVATLMSLAIVPLLTERVIASLGLKTVLTEFEHPNVIIKFLVNFSKKVAIRAPIYWGLGNLMKCSTESLFVIIRNLGLSWSEAYNPQHYYEGAMLSLLATKVDQIWFLKDFDNRDFFKTSIGTMVQRLDSLLTTSQRWRSTWPGNAIYTSTLLSWAPPVATTPKPGVSPADSVQQATEERLNGLRKWRSYINLCPNTRVVPALDWFSRTVFGKDVY